MKGKTLSALVLNIFEQFKEEFEKMSNKKYDPLDPACLVSDQKNDQFNCLSILPLGISR